MSNLKNINLLDLKKAVSSLKTRKKKLQKKEEEILRDKKENERCLSYLQMILDTHMRETTPPHTSGSFLFFFFGKNNEVALITELLPPDQLMPKMQRISIRDAVRCPMDAHGGNGFLIERVYFGTDVKIRTSARFVICLERMIVEAA